jgi:hypothetical protein
MGVRRGKGGSRPSRKGILLRCVTDDGLLMHYTAVYYTFGDLPTEAYAMTFSIQTQAVEPVKAQGREAQMSG